MAQQNSALAGKPTQKQISDRQRARITENFRAAKALLARKRPPQPVTSPSHHQIPHKKFTAKATSEPTQSFSLSLSEHRNTNTSKFCASSDINELPRYPLAEIQANSMTSMSAYRSEHANFQRFEFCSASEHCQNAAFLGVSNIASKTPSTSLLEIDKRQAKTKIFVSPDSNSNISGKENNASAWMESAVSTRHPSEVCLETATSKNCISLSDISDEEFDDALLDEIDALCKRRSTSNPHNVLTGSLNKSRENLDKIPSLSPNIDSTDVADWLCFEQAEVDYEDNFLGTKRIPVQTVDVHNLSHLSSISCTSMNSKGASLSHSASFVPSSKPNLSSAEVKTELEDAHISHLEILEAPVNTSNETVCSSSLSDANQDCGSSMINPGEITHQILPAQASVLSNNFLNESSNSCDLSISTSEPLPAYLQSLNDTQREAATSDISKPLMILAGPGSGKTSTVVARLLTLLKEGMHPTNILAMTFTTAAATEMRERVGAIVGKAIAKELTLCTFHSFCLQLCRLHAEKLGRTSEFLIYGHGQQRRAVIEAVRLAAIEDQSDRVGDHNEQGANVDIYRKVELCKERSKKWQQFVTQAKAAGRTPEDYVKLGNKMGAAILRHYNATLTACNALDYHDFISCAVKLLGDHSEVMEECQNSRKAILVDEFQDTSSMQYCFLRLLSSHNCITVVGDDDQSIFSFNGADISGFDSFRKDFPCHKEVRLHQNYRSTRCIVEAASSLIQNNLKRCPLKQVFTDNVPGDKIMVRECRNEDAQCAFVVDKILMSSSESTQGERSFASVAILYRRQVSGKLFQASLRARKIPFNVHGVAFYRKKVIKAVISMLQTALPMCGDGPCHRVFKAFYPGDKEEQKRTIEYVEKVANSMKCGFLIAARDIFTAKVSGTFNRRQLAQGRRVLFIIDTIHKLVRKEQSLSAVITSAINFLPQKFLFEKRAIVDEDGGKLLNEDDDPRSVLEYLLDDVSDFLCNHYNSLVVEEKAIDKTNQEGCMRMLKGFLDYLSTREMENFRCRRQHNQNSVTLTTMHQSKGLEWDTVFIVKANDSEIPLLHETMGSIKNGATSLEEERRLFYVAMTRARKKLYILYVVMDSNWQLLQPSRFLKELPQHLVDIQAESKSSQMISGTCKEYVRCQDKEYSDRRECIAQKDYATSFTAMESKEGICNHSSSLNTRVKDVESAVLNEESSTASAFLRGFSIEARSTVAGLFHTWAKKRAFNDPKRLLDKVGFVIDERIRNKTSKNKDVLRALKCCLKDEDAFLYAKHVLKWEQMPSDERSLLQAERQEHFQKQAAERSMDSSAATSKQISYLKNLGCTITPTSRRHASHLIEQYKSL